jgi:uncharacterized membrane protein YukC
MKQEEIMVKAKTANKDMEEVKQKGYNISYVIYLLVGLITLMLLLFMMHFCNL